MATVLVLAAGCVSTPGPAGPTTLEGTLPAPEAGRSAGATGVPGAVRGPLHLVEPRFGWTHASATASAYEWSCTVENPSHSSFEVTVVMQLLDSAGRALATTSQDLRVGAEDRYPLDGTGQVDADLARRVAAWKLEYWVRVPPRPIGGATPAMPIPPGS